MNLYTHVPDPQIKKPKVIGLCKPNRKSRGAARWLSLPNASANYQVMRVFVEVVFLQGIVQFAVLAVPTRR